ncbi:hypothetical protein AWN68_09645 [Roseivirga echinicomitans]|uniref:Uncharacterized protein n=1 Tax=Roseivirga echinicomitans TaxID=296218 RepID=A0A150X2Y8_9BACT|nr:DUF1295 domain-containing protein [Roseivirga echinicomitans]KYG72952.1 hypothetical protein AWN68_09645 [Roseivirga echinicomitans]
MEGRVGKDFLLAFIFASVLVAGRYFVGDKLSRYFGGLLWRSDKLGYLHRHSILVDRFFFQAVADYQLKQFKKKRNSKDEILQTGLWKYSRHPNYFGEIVMWWSLAVMVLPINYGGLAFISPVFITFLLLKVSGVPMLEKRYEGNEAFDVYKTKTPVVFPRFL